MQTRRSIALVVIIRLQIRIKGNSVGRTVLNHKSSPLLAPLRTGAGKKSISAKSAIRDRDRKIFLNLRGKRGMAYLRSLKLYHNLWNEPGFYEIYCAVGRDFQRFPEEKSSRTFHKNILAKNR